MGQQTRKVQRIVREKFGYADFRPGQEIALKAILAGRDTLAVMPTGQGKSLIYQVATLMLPGPAVVVSPLIALQRDQVESIEEMAVGDAAMINSTQRETERASVFAHLQQGQLDFLFLAPEQLANEDVLARLQEAHPALFVVDEAHCISEWGHDFRPEYLHLSDVIQALQHPTVLALTATAALPVRTEIVERLAMRDPQIIVQGFDRPNIWLGVETFQDADEKKQALLERVLASEQPGIVYAATRKHTEDVADSLRAQGLKAAFYHAGMKASEREQVQTQFMNDELAVIVATTAFGMGIDKPNIRFVFHYDISESLDAYYQEIGRAGRDGEEANAILFYRQEDLGIRRFLAGGGHSDEAHRQFDKSRIEMMRGYAEVQDCRREYLLNYFGEKLDSPCGYCDNCEAGIIIEEDQQEQPFPMNTRVVHKTWGEGIVLRYEGDKMVVLFDSVGYKTLSVAIVTEHALLSALPQEAEKSL